MSARDTPALSAYRVHGFYDITAHRFGKLVALSYKGSGLWHCRCDCGRTTISNSGNLRLNTRSCGCARAEAIKTHGLSHTKQYGAWKKMHDRCKNANAPGYPYYGGRGIKVCPEWDDYAKFLADMGVRPEGMSLERIDNDGDYCLANCCWATKKTQARNRRATHFVEFAGRRMALSAWAEELGIPRGTLRTRLVDHGWTPEQAFTQPVRPMRDLQWNKT